MPKWPEGKWSGSWQKEKLRILKRYENLTDLDILSEEICHLNRNMYLNENVGVDANIDTSTHGNEASFEFVVQKAPDYIFVLDRDAAISRE